MKSRKVLFLTLYTFSLTGGIEKVCSTFIRVLAGLKKSKMIGNSLTLSMYDSANEVSDYLAFSGNKIGFAISATRKGTQADIIILSHINLLIFAKLVRTIHPSKKIILFAHGIEIWKPLATWKKKMLSTIEIWAVSNYTAVQIHQKHQVPQSRIKILNNSLASDFQFIEKAKPLMLLEKYNINVQQKVLLTICRLSSAEQYKGYDLVLLALKDLIKIKPDFIYFIVGKADQTEQKRVDDLIAEYGLQKNVICTGYVSDEELNQYYQLADIFVMPSKGEGFGLVFIEAAAHGCHVIAGNADGADDALLSGELGLLVDPDHIEEIYHGLLRLLNKPLSLDEIKSRQKKVQEHFGFEHYSRKVEELLKD
ncbi:glycosyltransferase family 4 protein [Agrobacterium tumefaciens]|nr:glycosyltransferase family 4 protein [Agrobacterium tumefaciens]NTE18907.1 glycosyltransferase family 4 protein [Agrobacterium tumefaciens]